MVFLAPQHRQFAPLDIGLDQIDPRGDAVFASEAIDCRGLDGDTLRARMCLRDQMVQTQILWKAFELRRSLAVAERRLQEADSRKLGKKTLLEQDVGGEHLKVVGIGFEGIKRPRFPTSRARTAV